MQLLKTYGTLGVLIVTIALAACPSKAQDAEIDKAKTLLTEGVGQFEALNFADAKATLLKVDRSKLPPEQAAQLDQYLVRVDQGIKRQAAGNEAFEKAQAALKANQLTEARDLFGQVTSNEFVQAPIRKEAKAQAALVAERIKTSGEAVAAAPAAPASNASAETAAVVAEVAPASVPATVSAAYAQPASQPAGAALSALAERNAEQAHALVAQGNASLDAGNPAEALHSFNEALRLVPGMPEAEHGVSVASNLMGRTPAASPLSELERRQQVELSRARVQFEDSVALARQTLQTASTANDYAKASDAANFANSILETNRTLFPADEYATRKTVVNGLIAQVATERGRWEQAQVTAQIQQTQLAEQQRRSAEEMQKQQKIETLTQRARVLEREYKYEQAMETLDEILRLDPTNACALAKRESIERFMLLQSDKNAQKASSVEEMKQFVDVEWTRVPWYDLLKYPRNWPEITRRREPFGVGGENDTEADRAVRVKLRQNLPKLDFDEIEFKDVIDFLKNVSGVNIDPNWNALRAAGIDPSAPVTVHLTDVTLEKALKTVLNDVGGTAALGFVVDDGVITISSKDELSNPSHVYTRVYDIHDLIVQVPDFPGQSLGLPSAGTSGGGGGGGGTGGGTGGSFGSSGGGGGSFGGSGGGGGGGGGLGGGGGGGLGGGGGGGGTTGGQGALSRADLVTRILTLIRDTVARDSWVDNNGTVGNLRELNGQIVVTQTAENHAQLLNLLRQLREARAVQVNIEARFITIDTGYLQDIGLNLNFFLNLGSDFHQTATIDPVTGAQILAPGPPAGSPIWGSQSAFCNKLTAIPVVQGSSAFTTPGATAVNVPQSIGTAVTTPALSLGGTFLDDIQVDFLLRATEADQRSTTLTAPRLTLFNGQEANVYIATETAYVSDLTPVVAENVTSFQPTVSSVATGSMLDVQATVSPDRRYVTLTIHPQVTRIISFNNYVINPTGTAGGQILGTGVIQEPTMGIERIDTTVSVPDGGTLLVGGQKLAGEINKEMGVPVLSKIPVINRLFTNRSTVRDEETLLILIKPTIIIQREYEEDAFPSTVTP